MMRSVTQHISHGWRYGSRRTIRYSPATTSTAVGGAGGVTMTDIGCPRNSDWNYFAFTKPHSTTHSFATHAATVDGDDGRNTTSQSYSEPQSTRNSNKFTKTLYSDSAKKTVEFGKQAARLSQPGDVILLSGPMGSGKSEFARSFIREHVGDEDLEVPSPTFVVEYSYQGKNQTVHIDLFRVDPDKDMSDSIEALDNNPDSISLVEWPEELARDKLPEVFAAVFFIPSSDLESESHDLGRQLLLVVSGSNERKQEEMFNRFRELNQ